MTVRFRMYRQGLGDCLLLTFEANGAKKHLLVDCGVLVGSEAGEARIKRAVEDIRKTTKQGEGSRIDWVVATHEHWDHVSGFAQARDTFGKIDFGEVWLAWTEDPQDAQAKRLHKEREERIRTLRAALGRARASPGAHVKAVADRAEGVLGFFGPAAAAGPSRTAEAMEWVRTRVSRPRFLEPGTSFPLAGVPGARVFVLGPPRDERALSRSRPRKGTGDSYVRPDREASIATAFACAVAGTDEATPDDDRAFPFDRLLRLPLEPNVPPEAIMWGGIPNDPAVAEMLQRYGSEPWRNIDDDWLATAGDLALNLDEHTNNTSLVLAIELAPDGAVVLLAGDAQVGNWRSWEDLEFRVPAGPGGPRAARRVRTRDLLARTVIYKVGHHGSHNATLRDGGLERMTNDGLVAMLPVHRPTAVKQRWNMPYPPLFARLEERTRGRILRIDEGLPGARDLARLDDGGAEFLASASATDDYVEITVR